LQKRPPPAPPFPTDKSKFENRKAKTVFCQYPSKRYEFLFSFLSEKAEGAAADEKQREGGAQHTLGQEMSQLRAKERAGHAAKQQQPLVTPKRRRFAQTKEQRETGGGEKKDEIQPLGRELDVTCTYVNRAYALAYQTTDIHLWYKDQIHSNNKGAYLAACVMFSTLFNTSCQVLGDDDLPAEEALALRTIADQVVLEGKLPW